MTLGELRRARGLGRDKATLTVTREAGFVAITSPSAGRESAPALVAESCASTLAPTDCSSWVEAARGATGEGAAPGYH